MQKSIARLVSETSSKVSPQRRRSQLTSSEKALLVENGDGVDEEENDIEQGADRHLGKSRPYLAQSVTPFYVCWLLLSPLSCPFRRPSLSAPRERLAAFLLS